MGKVAVFQCSSSFDHLTAVSGVGSSPALATCETRQVLLAGVSGGFPGHTCDIILDANREILALKSYFVF